MSRVPRHKVSWVSRPAPPVKRASFLQRPGREPAAADILQIEHDDAQYLRAHREKMAEADAVAGLGLQLRRELVSYAPDSHSSVPEGGKVASSPDVIDPQKVAAAVSVISRQTALIGELKSAHADSVKVAAALAGAVKLAQDGAIDVEDIFVVAREAIEHGSVKLSNVDAVFDLSPGELVGPQGSEAAKQATGPDIPGLTGLNRVPETPDVFTATLRGLRRAR